MTDTTTSDVAKRKLKPRPWGQILERAQAPRLDPSEARAYPVVAGAVILSVLLGGIVVGFGIPPVVGRSSILAAALAALGLAAEHLSFRTAKNRAGSIALVPFAATLLVAPDLVGVALVAFAAMVASALARRPLVKCVFNVAVTHIAAATGVLAYRFGGGSPFVDVAGRSFVESARDALVPVSALVVAMFAANVLVLGAVIAVSTRKGYPAVVGQIGRTSIPFVPIITLVAFYLTWLSVNLGPLGTAGMVVPMLAVRQLYKTATELTNVTEELLDLMVAAIEARDPYTSGHSRRVAQASEIIAKAVGLTDAQVERVTVAALLHDVGKIDEAFAKILAKEGRLTPDEWEVMKRHPVRSAELVGMLTSLRDLVAPVRHHHENWDGSGYPSGLKGEAIPLASRIIMFADTLDAITTDRPYRRALGLEEARSEFIKFRGRQFDPFICDAVTSQRVWAELYATFGSQIERTASARVS